MQPNLSHDTLRALVNDRLVRKMAARYDPDRRHAADPDTQAEALAELAQDVVDLLPGRETPESIGLILDGAWKGLRRAYGYQSWPKTPTVLHHVSEALAGWRSRVGEKPGDKRDLPKRPALASPEWCLRKAEHFRQTGAEGLADYWQRMANDSASAWRAWHAAGGQAIDAEALRGSVNGAAERAEAA